jgi:hypothetical protein
MDSEFFKGQALRARGLAERADPFARKRLLDLAESYDARAEGTSRATRVIGLPVMNGWPASPGARSREP